MCHRRTSSRLDLFDERRMQSQVSNLNRGTILHFMQEALGELLKREQNPNAHNYSNLLGRTVSKLAGAGVIDSDSKFENLDSGDPLASLLVEGYQQLLISGYIIPRPGQT